MAADTAGGPAQGARSGASATPIGRRGVIGGDRQERRCVADRPGFHAEWRPHAPFDVHLDERDRLTPEDVVKPPTFDSRSPVVVASVVLPRSQRPPAPSPPTKADTPSLTPSQVDETRTRRLTSAPALRRCGRARRSPPRRVRTRGSPNGRSPEQSTTVSPVYAPQSTKASSSRSRTTSAGKYWSGCTSPTSPNSPVTRQATWPA